MFHRTFVFFIFISVSASPIAEVVSYEFDIDYQTVNISGKEATAMVIDGRIPAPIIEATVGDTLQVTFHNHMDVETSIHWHGVLLPNSQDGVPYLTTPPIKPGTAYTYEFPVTHAGTYWYHSHTGLQEQRGIYGPLVFHNKEQQYDYDAERIIVISDWNDENPKQVLRHLKREDDYYALKKDAVQSWQGMFENGWPAIRNRFNHAAMRMGAMDISDVGYDAFLINGKQVLQDNELKPGERVRLRIINAAASSYFYVDYAGGNMLLIEADGMPVEPLRVERLRLAIAETFDVIVTIPDNKAYELRATAEDVTGYASFFFGTGDQVTVKALQRPNPYLLDHSMHAMGHGDQGHSMLDEKNSQHEHVEHMQHRDMEIKEEAHAMHGEHSHESNGNNIKKVFMLDEYEELRSPLRTEYAIDNPQREVVLRLTGSMERYVWSFNDSILKESDRILVRKGETVRFVLKNETMMHHPLHLHGHFFRVLNRQGAHSPLKHTVNVPPFQTVTIEFLANEEKDWFFHCHNLYHMKSGMARVIDYDEVDQPDYEDTEFYRQVQNTGDPWFAFADTGFYSNMFAGELWAMNTRNTLNLHYAYDHGNHDYDIEAYFAHNPSRFLALFAGANLENEDDDKSHAATLGIQYTLPLLIEAELRYDTDGEFRFQLKSDHQLTKRTSVHWFWNSEVEYQVRLKYDFNKRISAVVNYDSDFDAGAGIEIHF